MQLLEPLASGVKGAENGSVAVYRRGTSTPATLYVDFEASAASAASSIPLDSYGRVVRYADGVVDCVVFDALNIELTRFTCGSKDASLEVISKAFTGTDYVTAEQAVSKPVDLETVLDLWKTNSGSIDWKVLVNGSALTLQAAFARSLTGVFFNVKDPTYAAKGDGTNDDTSAIQAALTAANAAGGGVVVFPKGTYRITIPLTCYRGVSMLGVGPSASVIKMDDALADALSFGSSGTAGGPIFVSGLTVQSAQTNSGALVSVTGSGAQVVIDRCTLGGTATTGRSVKVNSASAQVAVVDCCTYSGSTDGAAIVTTGTLLMRGGTVVSAASVASALVNTGVSSRLILDGVTFDNSLADSGTVIDVYVKDSGSVRGCSFSNGGGATIEAFHGASCNLQESGNLFGTSVTPYNITSGSTAATSYTTMSLGTRASRHKYYASDSASLSVDAVANAIIHIVRSTNADQAISLVNPPLIPGLRASISYYNGSSGTITTVTFNGTWPGTSWSSMVSHHARTIIVESVEMNGSCIWVVVGDSTDGSI